MKTQEILNNILAMLRTIKDDGTKLEKLHQYMMEEIYEEPEEEEMEIPESYRALVNEVAQYLDMGMICFVNPETSELISIPQGHLEDFWEEDEDPYRGDMNRIEIEWKGTITIEPPESRSSFLFMETFVDNLPNSKWKSSLEQALSRNKPFRNFNAIIHQSPIREEWFAFKLKCMEGYVAENLMGRLPEW